MGFCISARPRTEDRFADVVEIVVLWTERSPEDYMKFKSFLASVFLLVLFSCLFVGTKPTARETYPVTVQQRAEHRIKFDRGGQCTATAIAPHALLTASHCNEHGITTVYLDLSVWKYHILAETTDNRDHMVYIVDGPEFHDIVPLKVGSDPTNILEKVYMYGAGGGNYPPRRLSGQKDFHVVDTSEIDLANGTEWYSLPVIPGDSGAAIFGEDGRIIGVVSYSYVQNKSEDDPKYDGLCIAMDVNFTARQLEQLKVGIGDTMLSEYAAPPAVDNTLSIFKLFN